MPAFVWPLGKPPSVAGVGLFAEAPEDHQHDDLQGVDVHRVARGDPLNVLADRFDGKHFALHGLWPQPHDDSTEYCGFAATEITKLKKREWPKGATIDLDEPTRTRLAMVMPG